MGGEAGSSEGHPCHRGNSPLGRGRGGARGGEIAGAEKKVGNSAVFAWIGSGGRVAVVAGGGGWEESAADKVANTDACRPAAARPETLNGTNTHSLAFLQRFRSSIVTV